MHAGTLRTEGELPSIKAQLSARCRAGLRPRTALRLLLTVDRYIMGWATEEQAWRQDVAKRTRPPFPDEACATSRCSARPPRLRMTDHDADFDYGLRVLIEGFRAEICAGGGGRLHLSGESSHLTGDGLACAP
ncbi:TetR/AcrR family transcriptional regulator C-terminal domain-containing protein [Kitasatospora sp. NPDC053057]|uniref:TetR/AcrR family transcriptional regulator C-terminal domain-containing protein n=1 Tax=Kitasatospora sp. NPDC053057 TaxID=3364062 RepID=UPI0037CAD46A